MRLRFSVGDLYAYDPNGRPTFSVVGEPSGELRNLLLGCDAFLRERLSAMGNQAVWRPIVIRKVRNGVGSWSPLWKPLFGAGCLQELLEFPFRVW